VQQAKDPVLKDLSQRFVGRRLFKAIDLDMPLAERQEFLDAARDVVARVASCPNIIFIEDRASDVPYYGYYTPEGVEPRTHIYVEDGYAILDCAKSARSVKLSAAWGAGTNCIESVSRLR